MSAVSDDRQWAELAGDGTRAAVAQLVERVLGKDEVTGPSPVSSFGLHAAGVRRGERRVGEERRYPVAAGAVWTIR